MVEVPQHFLQWPRALSYPVIMLISSEQSTQMSVWSISSCCQTVPKEVRCFELCSLVCVTLCTCFLLFLFVDELVSAQNKLDEEDTKVELTV